MARNLLKAWPALWSFADHNGVQPTNNHAERRLRGAVIYRKLSLGSRSNQGEQKHRTAPLRLDHLPPPGKRSLFAYLTELLATQEAATPQPTLA